MENSIPDNGEPWTFAWRGDRDRFLISDRDGDPIASVVDAADAERICAAVNFCIGTDTESIERIGQKWMALKETRR